MGRGLGGYICNLFLGPDAGPGPGPDRIWGTADDENLADVSFDTASWSEVFAVAGANGKPEVGADVRATGGYGGPGMLKGSSNGYNSTPGALLQVGNGYLEWSPWRYSFPPGWGGEHTWGIGLDSRKETLLLDTDGEYELNTGSIDTTYLAPGHYVLTLVPDRNATVLRPDADLSTTHPGGVLLYADTVSGPVSIEFDIGEE